MIFIHGGLNTLTKRQDRTDKTLQKIIAWNDDIRKNKPNGEKEERQVIYPIFINWHSQFYTWWDRLGRIRDGRHNPVESVVTIPFAMFADAGRTFGRLPEVYYKESKSMWSNFPGISREVASIPDGWPAENISTYSPSSYPNYFNFTEHWSHSTSFYGQMLKIAPGVVRVATIPVLESLSGPGKRRYP